MHQPRGGLCPSCSAKRESRLSRDATGGLGATTGGDRTAVPALARAAVATGQVDGLFFEVHPDPDSSPSDGPNMIRLDDFAEVLDGVLAVHRALR